MSTEKIEVRADPEVLAAWQSHFTEEENGQGLTAAELAKMANVSETTMRMRLREGVKSGAYIASQGYRRTATGSRIRVPLYMLAETKPAPTTGKRRK